MKNHPKYSSIIPSPFGKIGIILEQDQLTHLDILSDSDTAQLFQNPTCDRVINELTQYFSNPQHAFTLSLKPKGSSFQHRVWEALTHIQSGKALTYGMLAKQLQTSPRAIGKACRTNPIPIIIPCHRIVAANHMGGYAGAKEGRLMEIKKWLLGHEGYIVT